MLHSIKSTPKLSKIYSTYLKAKYSRVIDYTCVLMFINNPVTLERLAFFGVFVLTRFTAPACWPLYFYSAPVQAIPNRLRAGSLSTQKTSICQRITRIYTRAETTYHKLIVAVGSRGSRGKRSAELLSSGQLLAIAALPSEQPEWVACLARSKIRVRLVGKSSG